MNTYRKPEETASVGANPNLAVFLTFILKLLPFAISGMTLYLGYDLYLRGVSGQASLVTDDPSLQSQLVNATPGLFLALGGFVALVVSILRSSPGSDLFSGR